MQTCAMMSRRALLVVMCLMCATACSNDSEANPFAFVDDPAGANVPGTLSYLKDVESAHLDHDRHVAIWLPPGYDADGETRYPVLYMHDGQNLFDPRGAYTGKTWGVAEVVTQLIDAGKIRPMIVVGAFNSPSRGYEYSPWHGAPRYGRFLTEELMPRIEADYRTLTGPENTFVMGSSMGGLLSYYLVSEHPDRFGGCGCVSTHFTISERMVARYYDDIELDIEGKPDDTPYIVRDIERGITMPAGPKLWFDYGTLGLDADYGPPHDRVRAWLLEQDRTEGVDFVVREYEGADHNEVSWRERLADPVLFLFGKG
ncbi:MAG: alpha/beta hydrolase-fold protein [Pseudomonadota bacterium]